MLSRWKRKGSGDSRGLQNRRSLSLMAMVGSTPTRFRQLNLHGRVRRLSPLLRAVGDHDRLHYGKAMPLTMRGSS
jgi:hypothetical protein